MKFSSIMSFVDEIYKPQVIILGICGYTNKVSESDLQDNTLTLLLQELGRIPDKILLPSDGNSSIYIQEWADALHIKSQLFHSDWIRYGKRAQIIRDDRIEKESTHMLLFLSDRSTRLEKKAESLTKKGKIVFTSLAQTLTQLELHVDSLPASKPAHKSNKGTMLMWLKPQK